MFQNIIYPTDPASVERLGKLAAQLLSSSTESRWLLRRKEKATLLDELVIRRQMSVDFVLPEEILPQTRIGRTGVRYAPLFFLPKGLDEPFEPNAPLGAPEPFVANFDLRDRSGLALSLPSRTWNGLVTTEMLLSMIEATLNECGYEIAETRDGIRRLCREICTSDHRSAGLILDHLREEEGGSSESPRSMLRTIRDAAAADSRLARMMEVCSGASVVMVPLIGDEARQGIVKLIFDEEVTSVTSAKQRWQRPFAAIGWGGYELWAETPYIGAASYHFEFEAPAGLEIYDSGLVQVDGPEPEDDGQRAETMLDRVSGYSSHLHLYEPEAAKALKSFAWIRLRVRRQEFVGGAAIAGGVVALAMWGAFFSAEHAALTPTAIPPLLLLVPSLIAAYAVRPGPHRLTARMLAPVRWIVAFSATIPFLAAAVFALSRRDAKSGAVIDGAFEHWWLVGAILASVAGLILLGSWAFPIPELKVQWWRQAMWPGTKER